MIALPDVNVLLALAWANHVHHDAAHDWFGRAAADGWATCLLTQSGFLRLSMNPHVVQVAIDCRTARNLLAGVTAHPSHQFASEAHALTADGFDPIAELISGYRQMTDATLFFFAHAHSLKLVTFDRAMLAVSPWPDSLEILAS